MQGDYELHEIQGSGHVVPCGMSMPGRDYAAWQVILSMSCQQVCSAPHYSSSICPCSCPCCPYANFAEAMQPAPSPAMCPHLSLRSPALKSLTCHLHCFCMARTFLLKVSSPAFIASSLSVHSMPRSMPRGPSRSSPSAQGGVEAAGCYHCRPCRRLTTALQACINCMTC